MDLSKRHLHQGAALLSCGLALATGGWFTWQTWRESRRELASLARKEQERDRLMQQSPAYEQAIVRDLAQTERMLAELRAALQDRDAAAAESTSPLKSIDALFDLAAFVERTRALAARTQVRIGPGERFGFANHATAGPATELVPEVLRQRLLAEYLLAALLEARPQALLAVQREKLPSMKMDAGTADFFEFVPPCSLRVPGQVQGVACRLEFTGQTPALRGFLNRLAAGPRPVIVRSVEAEPLLPLAASPGQTAAPGLLVAGSESRFTVVVEQVDVAPSTGGNVR